MGFFDNLRARTAAPKPPVADPNNQQQGQPGLDNKASNPNDQLPRNDLGNQSPLSLHEKLYDPITTNDEVPAFKLDSEKLKGVVDAQDFLRGVDPATMAALQAGDMSKLPEILQAATRASYQAALEHSSTLTDKYVGARFQHSDKSFGSRVKGEMTGQALSEIPGFNSPVVKQQLNDLANRLRLQHPDAPPKEIAEEAKRIMIEMAAELNPESRKSKKQAEEDENFDWTNYLTESPNQQ